GQPVLIDLGSARYEARTFGPQRYDIWINQSGWHNVPTIGDVMQSAGREFKATDVLYRTDHDRAEISFELATAYPAEAQVNTWRRTVTLHRGSEIVIADAGELAKPQRVDFNFITPLAPDVSAGELTLRGEDGVDFRLRFDASLVEPHIEPVEVTDAWLRNSWGAKIWRVVLRTRSEITRAKTVFHLSSASR
ncbi:MAG TPA: heparinase II/III family protein, partial [Opitutus sp.]|nr:heparinase II/III family protein [Opitutus sp.]